MQLQCVVHSALVATALSLTPVGVAPASAQTGTVIERHGDWSLLADGPAKTVCFIAATPKEGDAKAPPREGVVLYVSAWPGEGVKTELSAKLGHKTRRGSEVAISVGAASFKMFAKDDKAFVDDPTRELKVVEAMKKGAKATLRSEPEKGAAVTDTFSLAGFGQALQALATQCP